MLIELGKRIDEPWTFYQGYISTNRQHSKTEWGRKNNLNSWTTGSKTEPVIKKYAANKSPGPDRFREILHVYTARA